MSAAADRTVRGGLAPSALIASAVVLLALPSAVLAFSSSLESPANSQPKSANPVEAPGQPGDHRLSAALAAGSMASAPYFHFTPAGIAARPDRTVTLAVRVDTETARSITVRKPLGEMPAAPVIAAALRLAPTAYNLGVARGYQGFSLPGDIRRIDMPDLSTYQPSPGAKDIPSRFAPRVALDEREKTGRAPRTFEGNGDQTVDVGGSYRVTRNLDVTAGVRYSTERDRLVPLVDGQKDSQAIYVGTQFRF